MSNGLIKSLKSSGNLGNKFTGVSKGGVLAAILAYDRIFVPD